MVNPVGFAKGKWKSLFRMVIVIVVVAALGVSAQRSLEHWNQQPPEARLRLKDVDFRWLLLSAGLYAFALLPATMVLSRALNALGSQLPLRKVAAAQLIGHLGKYVPGKAMVIIIRTALLTAASRRCRSAPRRWRSRLKR